MKWGALSNQRKLAMTEAHSHGHRMKWELGKTFGVGRCIKIGCRAEALLTPDRRAGAAIAEQCKGLK